jgi:hypothetical protein
MSFTVPSTVEQNFAAKLCNSAKRAANAGLPKYLVSATLWDTVKTSAKTLPRITNQLLNPAELRPEELAQAKIHGIILVL